MTARGAVFLEALGAQADRLRPEILVQLRATADDDHAEGVFVVAGSRLRGLMALAAPIVGPGLCVTRFARDVPFRIRTTTAFSGSGRPILHTRREFRFAKGTQHVVDRLTATAKPGVVHNALGARGRVEMLEECSVTPEGALRMRTLAVALRLGRRRIALRGILGVHVDLVDGWDEAHGRRTVSMRARNPLLGTVLEYRGWYRYPDTEPDPLASAQ